MFFVTDIEKLLKSLNPETVKKLTGLLSSLPEDKKEELTKKVTSLSDDEKNALVRKAMQNPSLLSKLKELL